MYRKGNGATAWLVVLVLAGSGVVTPGARAQELESEGGRDGETAETSQFSVLVGMRGEFTGMASPGTTLDLVLNAPHLPIWVSLQFLAQMTRWHVDLFDQVRRNYVYSGRIRMGLGGRQGPGAYALFERGRGTILTPDAWDGDTYSVVAAGLGVAWTIGRVTASFEGGLGTRRRFKSRWTARHGSLAMSLQYQLLRTSLR